MRDQNNTLHIIKYKRCILNTHSLFAYFFISIGGDDTLETVTTLPSKSETSCVEL